MSSDAKLRRSVDAADGVEANGKAKDESVGLKPKLGLMNGITIIVGCMIGSGIFISPKGVIQGTGSVGLSITVWVLSGLFSLIGSYCYAELGTTIVQVMFSSFLGAVVTPRNCF